jgi:hypothetical protein
MSVVLNLWAETNGKIFLITFGGYLFSYLIYGGFIYNFLGKRGSIPLGFADFSITDLISIFPTAIFSLMIFISKAIRVIFKIFVIHLVIPMIIVYFMRLVVGALWKAYSIAPNMGGYLVLIGIFLWFLGFYLYFLQPLKIPRKVFYIIEIIGIIMFWFSVPNSGQPLPEIPQLPFLNNQGLNNFLYNIIGLELIPLPFLLGYGIGSTAINSNLLIKIDRLVFSQPILQLSMKRVEAPPDFVKKTPLRTILLFRNNIPINSEPEVYEWAQNPDYNLFLIATFEKFVLIFLREINGKSMQTLTINRDVILSIELAKETETLSNE